MTMPGRDEGLARDSALRVHGEDRVEDRVGDLVGELVRVPSVTDSDVNR